MANVLNTDKQISVVSAFAEGSSIRSIERMAGIHMNTIMRLGVRVGKDRTAMMDQEMHNPGLPPYGDGRNLVLKRKDIQQSAPGG